jgi:hypothetical protein
MMTRRNVKYFVGIICLIDDAKKRGVFVKELKYEIDKYPAGVADLKPYIEKGFFYGFHWSAETRELTNSDFPYQLNFNSRPSKDVGIAIKDEDLQKFDSCNTSWGFLKEPILKDTIHLLILKGKERGIIKFGSSV